MTRETAADKSLRLLAEGRVTLVAVSADTVEAVVHGDSGSHSVEWSAGRWSCTCASRRTCSHLAAVRRVVAVDLPDES